MSVCRSFTILRTIYLLSSHHLRLSDLKTELGQELRFASEDEIVYLFRECDRGAIPPVDTCSGIDALIDDDMERKQDIYLESGDHAVLVQIRGRNFAPP
ncbi:YbaK/EbsC family protein [Microvirga sp. BT325]|uniref:YbaK/EbsC family protein n=1 Tax=Microvirga splendida TaxID=2795727 RepID=A0ABS0XWI4_9HYPH|nr:YbaK/EbsC family protein [Microvirga splendida]